MASTLAKILLPDDGDLADAESVNNALRELSDLLFVQALLPLKVAKPFASGGPSWNAVVWNDDLGQWCICGAQSGSKVLQVLDCGGSLLRDYQMVLDAATTGWYVFEPVSASSQRIWASPTVPGTCAALYGIAVGAAGLYCAVGAGGYIVTSADGSTWTQRTPDASFAGDFNAVVWNGSLFVAVGNNGEIQTSPDGSTWTQRTPDASTGHFNCVTWDGTNFIAATHTGEIETSPDGTTWTQRLNLGAGNFFRCIAASPTIVVLTGAIGSTGLFYRSIDHGVTWTTFALPGISAGITGHGGAAYCVNADLFALAGNTQSVYVGHPSRGNWAAIEAPDGGTTTMGAVGSDGRRIMIGTLSTKVFVSSPVQIQRL